MRSHTRVRRYRSSALVMLIALAALTADCSRGDQKKYTWADRLPTANCEPRTQQAKRQIGNCPSLASPQHPRPEEVREFVDYMNKKQQIEGTVTNEGLEGPGCLQWRINSANGQPEMYAAGKKQGCVSVEDPIKKFKLP
jgi:hypothetical protein